MQNRTMPSDVDRAPRFSDAGVLAPPVALPTQKQRTSELQRTVVRAAGVGGLASVTVVTAAVALSGGGVGSIGAGLMVAGFDGIPFGAMIGAMVHFMRHPEEQ